MYTESILATYLFARWNHLETDVAALKVVVNHVVVPFVRSAFLHVKDALCGNRHPKPGMRPPSIQLQHSTTQKEQ